MEVKFANDDLARICTDDAHKIGLPVAVIKAARKTLLKLEAATFESDLFNLGAGLQNPQGSRKWNKASSREQAVSNFLHGIR